MDHTQKKFDYFLDIMKSYSDLEVENERLTKPDSNGANTIIVRDTILMF